MSKRYMNRDSSQERRKKYKELEVEGEAQAALWQALETLANQGINVGPKADAVLAKRSKIKSEAPK